MFVLPSSVRGSIAIFFSRVVEWQRTPSDAWIRRGVSFAMLGVGTLHRALLARPQARDALGVRERLRGRAAVAGAGTGGMNPCLLIPIYDHGSTIRRVVESLATASLPLVIVNDGSGPATRATLDCIARDFEWVEILSHAVNQGKGAALVTGYRAAAERGFTHVIQLDADAQHEAADVRRFLAVARANPDALVLGQPIFGDDVPRSRLYGRKLSVGLVWLATLSRAVRDPLCGFRCVPLAPALHVVGTRCRWVDGWTSSPSSRCVSSGWG